MVPVRSSEILRPLLALLILLWGFLCASPSFAQTDMRFDFFEDQSAHLTLSDIRDKPLTPFSGHLDAGYGASAYWIRIIVPATMRETHQRHALILRMTPTYIDSIEVFETCGDTVRNQFLGDQYPIANQAYPALSITMYLEPCALHEPIWLRVVSSSSRSLKIQVEPIEQAIDQDIIRAIQIILSASLILIFLAFIAAYEKNLRDQLFIAFGVQQIAILCIVLLNNGMGRVLLPFHPLMEDRLGSFATVFVTLPFIYFNALFLKQYHVGRWKQHLLNVMLGLSLVCNILVLTPFRDDGLHLNALLVSIALMFLFVIAVTSSAQSQRIELPDLKWIKLYYSALLLFVLPSILARLGLVGQFVPDVGTVYGIFSTFIMTLILVFRSKKRTLIDREITLELAIGEQRLRQEKRYREQQEQHFTMLVHEVKTPITALKLGLTNAQSLEAARQSASYHLDQVTSIINRADQSYRLEDPKFQVNWVDVSLSKLLERAIGDHDIEINIEPNTPEKIRTDPHLFHAIVSNLVDNASRYKATDTIPSMRVGVDIVNGQTGLQIEVINSPGLSGIPSEERIFSKYYRSDKAHHTSGSGLGLFLAYNCAKRLKGTLHYLFDGQIRFVLWLPL